METKLTLIDERAAGVPPEPCPGCGAEVRCGMLSGIEPCWCATLPPVMKLPEQKAAGCYCPACLAKRVAEQGGTPKA